MHETFRLKHAMGVRALEFAGANPVEVPRFPELKGRLAAAVEAGRTYAQIFGEGRDTSRSVTVQKEEERAAILDDIRFIVQTGRAVTDEVKELKGYWRVGRATQNQESLLARGRRYVEKVRAYQVVFTGYGYTPETLAATVARLDGLEASIAAAAHARAVHVGARAELAGIARRILASVDGLSAIYERTFADNLEKSAAWLSAAHIAWPESKALRAKRKLLAAGGDPAN